MKTHQIENNNQLPSRLYKQNDFNYTKQQKFLEINNLNQKNLDTCISYFIL